jgi:hypothetical protein
MCQAGVDGISRSWSVIRGYRLRETPPAGYGRVVLVLRMVEERFHRDDEGRPIREGRTPPELLGEGEIEYRRCPYAGSRFQHANPMNVSALRQTSAHWDAILDAVAVLRRGYAAVRGGYRADVWDVWRVGQLGSGLPWFFILHEGATCPAYAAALSKATLGVGIWAQKYFVDALIDQRATGPLTSQEILDTAEQNGTLIADHEVCAAGDKMMLKFFDAFVDDTPETGHSGLAARRDEALRFGAHYLAFKQWVWLYWLARRFLIEDLIADTGMPRTPALDELLAPEGQPPDFFLAEPRRRVDMPLAQREAWFRGLASTVVPFLPDRSDAPYAAHVARLAEIMGADLGRGAARAAHQYAALDELSGEVAATVEAGFGGTPGAFDPAMRDRLVQESPRALFAPYQTR